MNIKIDPGPTRFGRTGRVLYVLLLVFFVFAGPAPSWAGAKEYLPASIAGMKMQDVVSGTEAARIINRMHQGDVATNADYIAEYKGGAGSATYYLSIYNSAQEAALAMEDMAAAMDRGGFGFSHLMKRTAAGKDFFMALGQGQVHYFFARDVQLVWLAVDAGVAEQAVMEVLQGSVD